MPRGLISNENEINKIGKGGESVCTCWGEVLGPRTPIFEKNTWNFLRFLFEPANFFKNAAPIISSMIRGWNEAVDPVTFTNVFSANVSQFNHEQHKYSFVRNVLFFIGFLFTHQLFMLPKVRGCTRVYNGTEDVPA